MRVSSADGRGLWAEARERNRDRPAIPAREWISTVQLASEEMDSEMAAVKLR